MTYYCSAPALRPHAQHPFWACCGGCGHPNAGVNPTATTAYVSHMCSDEGRWCWTSRLCAVSAVPTASSWGTWGADAGCFDALQGTFAAMLLTTNACAALR